ncbi:MAG: hypothetical protein JWL77_2221 [Chthonomonadaceae bacterium]|nr:hypothetical protein [Chthonomonadaceae bacterium]
MLPTLKTAVLCFGAGSLLGLTPLSASSPQESTQTLSKTAEGKPIVWTYSWKSAPNDAVPVASVCPLKYGKKWAYSVEIDDGPVSTLTVSQPLLEKFTYTDAPPGVSGGKIRPFVGGAAVFPLRLDTGNDTFLTWQQLHTLKKAGWGVLNHSYWHSGNSWDPKSGLKAPQFRDELFWSQAILAAEAGDGRSPTHFVYPNGYREYTPYLKEYGFHSASRVAGKFPHLANPATDFLDIDRNYLDESVWSKPGDPMAGIPPSPGAGDFVIDFTHGMEADPASANHKRWLTRLGTIAARSGSAGDDTLWCAPTSEVVDYSLAARAATLRTDRGRVTLSVPTDLSGTALTLHLVGISPQTVLTSPPGGILYRQGEQVWITTPPLGAPGTAPPKPGIVKVYEGSIQDFTPARPIRLAGVRVLQRGEPKSGFALKIDLTAPDGKTSSLFNASPGTNWGSWLLYPIVPNRPALLTKGVHINTDPSLSKMEVWVLAE